MQLDPVFLSRVQFGLTAGFHFIFPPLTIGLSWLMVIMEGKYLATGRPIYETMARFWTKIFALIFAMGVATGIVLEFQFGTNWATYSRTVGDIFGAALAAEGIFAFFLESGFLAVLVFGWDRVSKKMHFFSTLMVACGSTFSAVWIIVANSWQQTPAGFTLMENDAGQTLARLESFWAAVLNPSTLDRLGHTLVASAICGGFFMLSVSAFYLLKRRHDEFARRSIGIALPYSLVFSLLALLTGHSNAVMVSEHQPAKLAAMEGLYETTAGGTPLYVLGVTDTDNQSVSGLAIPGLLSYLVHGDWTTPVLGFDQIKWQPDDARVIAKEDWPPVQATFQSYHLMVALGMLFILITAVAQVLQWTGRLFTQRWLLRIFVVSTLGPIAACQFGWITAEVGRQPWIVYNVLRTSDGSSFAVDGTEVMISIVLFTFIYLMLLFAWLFILDRKIKMGPQPAGAHAAGHESWVTVAGDRAAAGGESMTDAHDDVDERKE